MQEGWIDRIPNIRYPKVGPRFFDVVRVPEECSAGRLSEWGRENPRGVIHETQGTGLPSYSNSAPHLTIGPRSAGGRWQIFQHIPLGMAACALRSSGTAFPPTNYGARLQVELIGMTVREKHMPRAPEEGIAAIESMFEWAQAKMGIPEVYPYDPADMATGLWASTSNPWRRSEKWEQVDGWHPHAAVDHNDHWDVGGLLVPVLLRREAAPPMVDAYGIFEIWRPDDGHDHLHSEQLVRPVPSLREMLKAAGSKQNRKEIRAALDKKHQVRIRKVRVERRAA